MAGARLRTRVRSWCNRRIGLLSGAHRGGYATCAGRQRPGGHAANRRFSATSLGGPRHREGDRGWPSPPHARDQYDLQGRRLKAAVEQGVMTSGVMSMHSARASNTSGRSIRDDGPLPDTSMSCAKPRSLAAQLRTCGGASCRDASRHRRSGKMLPSWVKMVSVDINRGRHQTRRPRVVTNARIVTDWDCSFTGWHSACPGSGDRQHPRCLTPGSSPRTDRSQRPSSGEFPWCPPARRTLHDEPHQSAYAEPTDAGALKGMVCETRSKKSASFMSFQFIAKSAPVSAGARSVPPRSGP